ncbi:hypothetical protein ES703_62890 [subsurface metagenome]
MARHAGQPFFCPQHMAYLHQMVVNHVGQVIGRVAIRFEQDIVIQGAVLHRNLPPDDITEAGLSLERHFEPHHRGDTFVFFLRALCLAQVTAASIVAGRLLSFLLLGTHFRHTLR